MPQQPTSMAQRTTVPKPTFMMLRLFLSAERDITL